MKTFLFFCAVGVTVVLVCYMCFMWGQIKGYEHCRKLLRELYNEQTIEQP